MSNELAIAGVTAVLRDRLNDGLVNHNVAGVLGSTVNVNVTTPDRVVAQNSNEASQLNLFLYQVSPNPGWRNEALPSHDSMGQRRLSNPPLALDLYYLVSAYSAGDLHAEILLGYAMKLMHDFPVLTREMIRTALDPSPDTGVDLPPALRALADCGLADQVELLRISPQFLNTDEMSKLWTSTQSSYRPSAAYHVSVVLIESTQETTAALPVLTRGPLDPLTGQERGVVVVPTLTPPLPTIEVVRPAANQPVGRINEIITLEGHHLDGTAREVRLRNEKFNVDEILPAIGTSNSARMEFEIPAARSNEFPVGLYDISARLIPTAESNMRETNLLGLTLAPDITNLPQNVVRDGFGDATITLDFTPVLRTGQSAFLFLDTQSISPESFVAPVSTLVFIVRDADVGSPLARLRIDGIDSPVTDRDTNPPEFLDVRVTIT